jgi:hypothetical protein
MLDCVPLHRCLLLVDRTTDHARLTSRVQQAWSGLAPSSPNLSMDAASLRCLIVDPKLAEAERIVAALFSTEPASRREPV